MEAGKHSYCEKPLGRTPEEVRDVYQAVKRAGKKFQGGTLKGVASKLDYLQGLGVAVPSTAVFEHPTVESLAGFLVAELFPGGETTGDEGEDDDARRNAELDQLSDDELEATLLDELENAGY